LDKVSNPFDMIYPEDFSAMALSFPGTEQAPHFERMAFRVVKKRIFATLDFKSNTANLMLNLAEQASFSEFVPEGIFPLPNKWGQKGWTTFDLRVVSKEVLQEALLSAYSDIIGPKSK
tara:strand:- start:29670 stop:30023 length:354 start_codon:yes stop_codon:yes gene_type:complete